MASRISSSGARFDIPKTGDFDRYRTKKWKGNLDRAYASLDTIRGFCIPNLNMPFRKEGNSFEETINLYLVCMAHRSLALSEGAIEAWNSRNPLIAVIACRTIMETVAMSYAVFKECEARVQKGDLKVAREIAMSNLLALDDLPQKRGMRKAISLKSAIDAVDRHFFEDTKTKPFWDHYARLSKTVHPNWPGTLLFFCVADRRSGDHFFTKGRGLNSEVFMDCYLGFVNLSLFEFSFLEVQKLISAAKEIQEQR